MDKQYKSKGEPPDLNPVLRGWIDNVIVPALVDRYVAQTFQKFHGAPAARTITQAMAQPKAELEQVHRAPESMRMLTVAEAAEHLGLRQSTIRAWIAGRRITYVRMGRAIRIPARAVQELIERGTVPAKTLQRPGS